MSKKNSFANLKRIMSYSKGSELKLCLTIVMAIFTSILTLLIPYFVGKTIDVLDGNFELSQIVSNVVIIGIIILVTVILTYVMNTLNYQISYDIIANLRNSAYQKINRLPISYIERTSVGTIESLVVNDCETISDGLLVTLNQLFTGVVTIIAVFIIMLTISWKLALIIAVVTPITVFITSLFLKSINKHLKAQSKEKGKQTGYINEMITNINEIHSYDIEGTVDHKFTKINNGFRKKATKAVFLSSLVNPGTRLFNGIIYAIVALIGSISVMNGSFTIGALASLLAYATTFMKPINEISGVFSELSDSLACASRVFDFMDENETEDVDSSSSSSKIDGHITLKNVTFSYDGKRNVIDNLSLDIPAGTKVAIVGPTGCGKSTLINLLMRFYEPTSGEILIDNKNISSISKHVLREHVGMVPQDTWFKTTTIKNNILYGVARGSVTDDDMIKTSRKLGVHGFISHLPKKYEEIITSKRDDISDGQKQLLSISRAYISNPSILILDEATSSVDAITENMITNAVRELCKGRTSIIIAHRLSTIIDADMIVVMENGKIIELGNHNELVNKGGFYSKLYESFVE